MRYRFGLLSRYMQVDKFQCKLHVVRECIPETRLVNDVSSLTDGSPPSSVVVEVNIRRWPGSKPDRLPPPPLKPRRVRLHQSQEQPLATLLWGDWHSRGVTSRRDVSTMRSRWPENTVPPPTMHQDTAAARRLQLYSQSMVSWCTCEVGSLAELNHCYPSAHLRFVDAPVRNYHVYSFRQRPHVRCGSG